MAIDLSKMKEAKKQLEEQKKAAEELEEKLGDLELAYIIKFGNISNATEKTKQEMEKAQEEIDGLRKEFVEAEEALKPLQKGLKQAFGSTMQDEINKIGGAISKGFKAAFSSAKNVVLQAAQANAEYYKSLNSIVGIQGQVGKFGQTLRAASTGLATKSDLSSFFGSTGAMFASAEAMAANVKNAKNLVTALGDANTAATTFQQIQLLSADSQKEVLAYYEKQAKAIEGSASGSLLAAQNLWTEIKEGFGNSLMVMIKPILEFVSQVAQSFKDIAGFNISDQTTAAADAAENMSEETRKALDELNEIQRLQSTGFTSSLDEVHEIGQAYIESGDEEMDSADKTEEAEEKKQKAMSKTNEKAVQIAKSLAQVINVVIELSKSFADLFSYIMPAVTGLVGWILKIVSGFVSWLSKAGLLKTALSALVGVIVAVKVAQLGLAMANAISKVAASGPAAPVTAAAIGVGVGAIAAIFAGVGLSGAGSVSTPSVSQASAANEYQGTSEESKVQVAVYLDGKKVNDGLANSKYYDEEVKIS